MSPKRYVFTNADNLVVQAIDGNLTEADLQVFLRDYAVLFAATDVHVSDPALGVMAGWIFVDGDFVKPKTIADSEPDA